MDSHWPFSALAFLHDCACCLALARCAPLRLSAQGTLGAKDVARLAAATASLSSEQDVAFTVGLLHGAGLLRLDGSSLSYALLSDTWLTHPATLQLTSLRSAWWRIALDPNRWFPLVFPPAWKRRWTAVVQAICSWLVRLPPGDWGAVAMAAKELEQRGLFSPPGATGNLPAVRQAVVGHVFTLTDLLLTRILPRLGLVETNEMVGEIHLRPTAEGRHWLRAALNHWQEGPAGDAAVEMDGPPCELDLPPVSSILVGDAPDAVLVLLPLTAPIIAAFVLAQVAERCRTLPALPANWPQEGICYQLTEPSLAQLICLARRSE